MPSSNLIRVPPPTKPTPCGTAYLAKIHSRYLNNPIKWSGLHSTLFWTPSLEREAIYNRWLRLQPARRAGLLSPADKKWEAANWEAAILFQRYRNNWHKRRDAKIQSAYLSALKKYNIKFDAWSKQNSALNATVRPVFVLPDLSLPPPGYKPYINSSSTQEMSTQTESFFPDPIPDSSSATNSPIERVDKLSVPINIQRTLEGSTGSPTTEVRKLLIRIKDLESDNKHLESTRDDLLKTVLEYEDKSSKKKSGFLSKFKK